MSKRAKKIIDKIQSECVDGIFVFRGTPQVFSKERDGVSSSLYYAIKKGKREVLDVLLSIEKATVNEYKRMYSASSNVEVITKIRHYGGAVNAIDFTRDLFVALFFACNGSFEDDGEIIFVNMGELHISNNNEIDYEKLPSKPMFIRPAYNAVSRVRVIAQKSVFVYANQGYLDKKYYKKYPIPAKDKEEILRYIRNFHDIDQGSIYNDLIGFIKHNESNRDALIRFIKGNKKFTNGKFKDAIQDFDEAIKLNPSNSVYYNSRGIAKVQIEDYREAIRNFDKAIELNPREGEIFYNRGWAKLQSGNKKEAKKDIETAKMLISDIERKSVVDKFLERNF